MKVLTLTSSLIGSLALAASMVVVSSLVLRSPSALAQVEPDPQSQSLSDFIRPKDSGADAFGRGGGLNPLELIHRANLSNSKTRAEFLEEQRQNINSEASDFRTRQLELIRSGEARQSGTTPVN